MEASYNKQNTIFKEPYYLLKFIVVLYNMDKFICMQVSVYVHARAQRLLRP